MITKQQKQRIRRLLEEGDSQEKIAKRLNVSRHQVRLVLKESSNEEVQPAADKQSNNLEDYRSEIIQWLDEKKMSSFLIHQRLTTLKLDISLRSVQRYIKTFARKEVYIPVHVEPGEEAQVDYGYLGEFVREEKRVKVWVFNMVLSYSRYAFYMLVTEQTISSFIHCHQQAFEFFGGSPVSVKIDNLGAGVLEADFYQADFQRLYLDFLGHYGVTVVNARICRGQDKGKVEAGIKYVKRNFLPGLNHRDYSRLCEDLNKWNRQQCNLRTHGTTRKIPNEVFIKIEKLQLFTLPPERFAIIEREVRKVDMYGHIYFRYNFYSVPYHYAGDTITIEIGEKTLRVMQDTLAITTHVIHPGKGRFITMDCHKPYHKQAKTTEHYREELQKIGESAVRMQELLKAEKPFHWKNMVKGILSLKLVYRPSVIEASCLKATEEGHHDYKHVRQHCRELMKKKLIKEGPNYPKDTNGYYHELSSYDRLVNKSA